MTDLVIGHLDAPGMRAIKTEILALYREVYAGQLDAPFRAPDRFWERLDARAGGPARKDRTPATRSSPVRTARGRSRSTS